MINMECTITHLPYRQTGYFSGIITDYLGGAASLEPFYVHRPDISGIKNAVEARRQFPNNRKLLVEVLEQQYTGMEPIPAVQKNIADLADENTFTVTTAHQPAIFTGTLYFIYKILHTIKLAAHLQQEMPGCRFVPVFCMGSEDADLDELGKIYLGGEKITWDTRQTGAVGRMHTKGLDKILNRIAGELSVQPHGNELVQLLRDAYVNSPDIQTATFRLLHRLFGAYGLLVLIPDNRRLKQTMLPVFADDIFNNTPSALVNQTVNQLAAAGYKVQANPRAINLFYLEENRRERIEQRGDGFEVLNTPHRFSKQEMQEAMEANPERFSPNVILRGLFQETVLPNIAFIGGGGELAYWLELKDLFAHYQVPYPALVLRNSFLVVEKKWTEKIAKLGFRAAGLFASEQQLLTELVTRDKNGQLKLADQLSGVEEIYRQLQEKAAPVDKTLEQHIAALRTKTIRPLQELEKKMLRAEKRKHGDAERQIHAIKAALFPLGGLQERIDNFMPYYARWGAAFMNEIHRQSLSLEQQFTVIEEQ